jgi:hypothetical protein
MPLKLTKKEKECVKEWLKDKDCGRCPFTSIKRHLCFIAIPENRHRICKSWFPKLIDNRLFNSNCPCSNYNLSTVIRRAKEMIK